MAGWFTLLYRLSPVAACFRCQYLRSLVDIFFYLISFLLFWSKFISFFCESVIRTYLFALSQHRPINNQRYFLYFSTKTKTHTSYHVSKVNCLHRGRRNEKPFSRRRRYPWDWATRLPSYKRHTLESPGLSWLCNSIQSRILTEHHQCHNHICPNTKFGSSSYRAQKN